MAEVPSSAVQTVVVVDDHRSFAESLELALNAQQDFRCVGLAHSGQVGLDLVARLDPDVVVLDVRLAEDDGIEFARVLRARNSDVLIALLTAYADEALMRRVAESGANCLLSKDGSLTDLLDALRTSPRDGLAVHPHLLRRVLLPAQPLRTPVELTPREQQVLDMLGSGRDTGSIARTLGISLHTCRGYVKSLLTKLNAHSQLEAVAIARERRLLHSSDRP